MDTLKSLLSSKYFRLVIISIAVVALLFGTWNLYRLYQDNLARKRAASNRRPSAAFVNIKNKDTLSASVPIEIRAADKNGIKQVTFYIDNKRTRIDTAKPYCLAGDKVKDSKASPSAGGQCLEWDSKTLANGPHELLAVVVDKLGTPTRIRVSFSVKN